MFIRIQEPALKTWKRVSHILNSLWSKLYQPLPAIEVSKVELDVWNAREMWGLCVFGWDKVKISRFSWLFWSREWRGASRNSMASSCQKLKHSIHFFGQFHLHSRQLYIALFQKVDADSRNIFNKRLCRQFPWINLYIKRAGMEEWKQYFYLTWPNLRWKQHFPWLISVERTFIWGIVLEAPIAKGILPHSLSAVKAK